MPKKVPGEPKHELVGLRLSGQMRRMLEDATKKDMHISVQELVRSAIREYVERHYPRLFERYKRKIR